MKFNLIYPIKEHYCDRQGVAPISTMLADKPNDLLTQVGQVIAGAARQYATAEGTIRMENEAICVSGRR